MVAIDEITYGEQEIRVLLALINEHTGHRARNVSDFFKVFNAARADKLDITPEISYRLSRLAGTTLLEAAHILLAIKKTQSIPGDWCEYGVAHGRTSALLAQVLLSKSTPRKLWLYDFI